MVVSWDLPSPCPAQLSHLLFFSPYFWCSSTLFLFLKSPSLVSPQGGLRTSCSFLSGMDFIQMFAWPASSHLSDLSTNVLKVLPRALLDYLTWSNPSDPLYHVIILFSTWYILLLAILFLINWKYWLNFYSVLRTLPGTVEYSSEMTKVFVRKEFIFQKGKIDMSFLPTWCFSGLFMFF